MRRLSKRDLVTVGMIGFFFLVAVTFELYFLLFHRELPARADRELFARMFRVYGWADRDYYDPVSPLALSLEAINVFMMQPLGLWLAYAILRRRPYRWPLQLGVGAYLSVSVILYFSVGIVSGYARMGAHTVAAFALFYGANLPWLVGYGWMALDASRVIATRFASAPARVQRDRVAPVVEELGQEAPEVEPGPKPGEYRQGAEPLTP
ncbi:MAG: EXPERA domain-containing protein [Steroidobacteraceae bacterium]